tara:strand:- start:36 stop:404 length:369 start_codon:yes stop_codon:yes gene_type:complete
MVKMRTIIFDASLLWIPILFTYSLNEVAQEWATGYLKVVISLALVLSVILDSTKKGRAVLLSQCVGNYPFRWYMGITGLLEIVALCYSPTMTSFFIGAFICGHFLMHYKMITVYLQRRTFGA